MRSTWMLIGLLLVGCAGESGPEVGRLEQGQVVYKQNLKGGSAYASFWSETDNGYVNINKQGAGKTTLAYLDFGISKADPTSLVCETYPVPEPPEPKVMDIEVCYYTRFIEEYGYGEVPVGEVQIGKKGASVNTTVAPGPSYWITRCTIDYTTYIYDCVDGTGGTIAATWAQNGMDYSKRSGTEEYGYQGFAYKTSGSFTSYSATVEGTLLGNSFSASYGYLYTSVGASREIIKKQALPPAPPPPPMP